MNILQISKTVIEWWVDGLEEKDAHEDIPLIVAIKNRAPNELLSYLLRSDPHGARVTDRFGNLPLHLCCQFNEVSYEFFEQLVDSYKESVSKINKTGLLPLHKACHFNAPVEMMKLIIKRYPDSVKGKDKHGNLPIHYMYMGMLGPPDSDKLNLMLKCYANALSVMNNKGFLPLMMMNCPQDRYKDEYL